MSRTSEKPIWTEQLLTYNPQSMFFVNYYCKRDLLGEINYKVGPFLHSATGQPIHGIAIREVFRFKSTIPEIL